MAESQDVTELQENLTIQQVILDSLESEYFEGIEEERQEARREIQRLKTLLAQANRRAAHSPHNHRAMAMNMTPSPSAAMAKQQENNDIWSSPGSATLPSRKRNYSNIASTDPNVTNKSRRTTPSPAGMPTNNYGDDGFDPNSIDIIDLTRDDIDDDSDLVAKQMAEFQRQVQEKEDRDMALRLSSQDETYRPQSAISPHHNAFTKLMGSQRPNPRATPGLAGPSTGPASLPNAEQEALISQAPPQLSMPGAYNSEWDDPFMSRPALVSPHPTQHAAHEHDNHAASPVLPQLPTQQGQHLARNPALSMPTAFSSPVPGSYPAQSNGPWTGPRNSPYRANAFDWSTPANQGFTNGSGVQPWSASGRPSTNGLTLMNIIDKTSMFDYASGTGAIGEPLPERLTSYLQDAFHDPRVTEKELDELLQNIRPDLDISEKNREGTPAGLKNALYPHQELALTWMKKMEDGSNKGGILADDMGLGKTISTLALILDHPPKSRPKTNLIIGPLSLIRQWEEEIRTKTKLSHRLSTFVYHNKKATSEDLLRYDVVLTTYGTIASELKRLEKYMEENVDRNIDYNDKTLAVKCPLLHPKKAVFYRVILDEAQCIKNKGTQTAKACYKLRTTYRWCLTGTPMMNGVLEMFSLLHFLRSKPYGNWERFRDAFGVLFGQRGDAKSVAMSRLRALLKAVMLRRKKDSQLDGKPILRLPEKSEEIVYAQLSEEEKDFYKQLEKKSQVEFSKYLREGSIGKNYSNILVLLLRLRQACCHPHLNLDVDDVNSNVNENMLDTVRALDKAIVARIKAIEAFECPICQDAVQCPSFLVPCGHDSCAQCLTRLVDDAAATNLREGNESDRAKCPLCRGLFDPKKCFTYDAFQKIHMPKAVKEEEKEEASEAEDSDSDDDSEGAYASDDEVDDRGNLKGFVVADENDDFKNEVDEKGDFKNEADENGGVQDEADENGGVQDEAAGLDKPREKVPKNKGKKKQKHPEVRPSMLKSLRKEASKNREAFKRYMRYLRKTWLPAAKVSRCMELLKEIQATGEKTIVFSQWTLLLDLLEVAMWHEKLSQPARYDGSMSGDERSAAAARFRDNKKFTVMLVSLRAGNAGLNLTAASRVIIMDPFWNPYIEMQAVDRAYRIGQQKPVKVYRILTQDTVEDRIVALQDKKKKMVEAALDETESMKIGRLGANELKFLFFNTHN